MMKRIFIGRTSGAHAPALAKFTYSNRVWLCAVLVGLLGGLAAAVVQPLLLIGGLIGIATSLAIPLRGYRVFWAYLIFLLVGYFALSKGFAYIGVYPVFVAEIGLALGGISTLVTLLFSGLKIGRFHSLTVALLFVFIAWQALSTFPYLDTYGVAALRDAALWGYAAFTIFVLLLVPRRSVDYVFILYGKVIPYGLTWLLVAWVFTKQYPLDISFPGSPVPLLFVKPGDAGVYLAGAAAFMLLRLDSRTKAWSSTALWFLWGLWGINWLVWSVESRTVTVIGMLAIGVVFLFRPRTRLYRPLILVSLLLVLLFVSSLSVAVVADPGGAQVSAQQLVMNVTSTFGEGSDPSLEGTESWRGEFWSYIVGYTFNGEYFWSGKGYGIDLAADAGLKTADDDDVRSPHNVFMTILARSGVTGLVLWLLFLASFGWELVRRAATKTSADSWSARYALWLLVYWLAILFTACTDVYLEGPMGGVWFWSLVGMSLVYFSRGANPSENHRVNGEGGQST